MLLNNLALLYPATSWFGIIIMAFMALAYDSNMANNNDLHSVSLSISDKVISRIYVRCRAQNNLFF